MSTVEDSSAYLILLLLKDGGIILDMSEHFMNNLAEFCYGLANDPH